MGNEREARHLAELLKAQGLMADVIEVPNGPSRPARDGETLSDEPMLADELWSDEHEDAIGLACEKLWNGEPPNNPIHCPRPADHPLVLIANRALDAQNAAAAMYVALVKRQAQVAALRAQLADARAVGPVGYAHATKNGALEAIFPNKYQTLDECRVRCEERAAWCNEHWPESAPHTAIGLYGRAACAASGEGASHE